MGRWVELGMGLVCNMDGAVGAAATGVCGRPGCGAKLGCCWLCSCRLPSPPVPPCQVIRMAPNLPDPYHTLGLLHEAVGDAKKASLFGFCLLCGGSVRALGLPDPNHALGLPHEAVGDKKFDKKNARSLLGSGLGGWVGGCRQRDWLWEPWLASGPCRPPPYSCMHPLAAAPMQSLAVTGSPHTFPCHPPPCNHTPAISLTSHAVP